MKNVGARSPTGSQAEPMRTGSHSRFITFITALWRWLTAMLPLLLLINSI